jgi:transcriptional regulator with XRE-family HTH domain
MQIEELASLIEYHRKRSGLSQSDLARHAGVSRSVVQDLEAGNGRTAWNRLAAVLGVLNLRLEPVGPLVGDWQKRQSDGTAQTIRS